MVALTESILMPRHTIFVAGEHNFDLQTGMLSSSSSFNKVL